MRARLQPHARPGVVAAVRAALVVIALPAIARAGTVDDPLAGPQPRLEERAHSIGAMTGVSWDGAPSAGLVGRVGLSHRWAVASQVRTRSGLWLAELDGIFELTQGRLASTAKDGGVYPVKFELVGGVGVVDVRPIASFGVALRVRATRRFTIDVSIRDEVGRAELRPHPITHVPELQVALSFTAGSRLREPDIASP